MVRSEAIFLTVLTPGVAVNNSLAKELKAAFARNSVKRDIERGRSSRSERGRKRGRGRRNGGMGRNRSRCEVF